VRYAGSRCKRIGGVQSSRCCTPDVDRCLSAMRERLDTTRPGRPTIGRAQAADVLERQTGLPSNPFDMVDLKAELPARAANSAHALLIQNTRRGRNDLRSCLEVHRESRTASVTVHENQLRSTRVPHSGASASLDAIPICLLELLEAAAADLFCLHSPFQLHRVSPPGFGSASRSDPAARSRTVMRKNRAGSRRSSAPASARVIRYRLVANEQLGVRSARDQ